MKKIILFIVTILTFFISVPVQAQYVPPDIGIEPADAVNAIVSVLGTAIASALGLAVTIYGVMVGWKKIKILSKG